MWGINGLWIVRCRMGGQDCSRISQLLEAEMVGLDSGVMTLLQSQWVRRRQKYVWERAKCETFVCLKAELLTDAGHVGADVTGITCHVACQIFPVSISHESTEMFGT
ncbi:hypothetical protein MRB53_024242 [Persea americana]|uniref:Uncharacterized protein n=1 Tax=Persea americana TaxID=3435 RepID=A0ACC2LBX9_PERAE|nr:hypothetical protein MRB53_024242 [Persea americana]